MPLKFWKKEKPEKGKDEEEAEEEKPTEAPKAKVAPPEQKAPKPEPEAKPAKPAKPAEPLAAKPPDLAAVTGEVHAALVEFGLTVPATKAVFEKRIGMYPGGAAAFLADYRSAPYRAVTRILADWLGFRVPEEFEPGALLAEVNPRLSSFKLTAEMKDITWLDRELGLRKGKLVLGDQERVVRFKNPRDFVKGVNDLIAPKRIAFLELETWADDYAFLIVREPRWAKLAATELVVVKADQTSRGGECGECGAPVGKYWSDCLKCGAVFG